MGGGVLSTGSIKGGEVSKEKKRGVNFVKHKEGKCQGWFGSEKDQEEQGRAEGNKKEKTTVTRQKGKRAKRRRGWV